MAWTPNMALRVPVHHPEAHFALLPKETAWTQALTVLPTRAPQQHFKLSVVYDTAEASGGGLCLQGLYLQGLRLHKLLRLQTMPLQDLRLQLLRLH
eukprot:CAMPEP_0181215440 /NCGR_PEP_ID=MMETSP1096-20121128/26018_1 /TAXON_ID=156174 ORGANISM="Chrysochromulina ericina, Strain CCMP281" /NCGR_SAMPLE_ID=MMETSP1096 /ASSEMBLY_ACC=CAM_ASM_000453 /LENGTH=95 /DNA_ID=CAMNT_0023307303 /DNA_START=84 /DNA_END=370 /DNA_ORIENTATION=-